MKNINLLWLFILSLYDLNFFWWSQCQGPSFSDCAKDTYKMPQEMLYKMWVSWLLLSMYVFLFLGDFPTCGKAVYEGLSLGEGGFKLSSHLFILGHSQQGSVLGQHQACLHLPIILPCSTTGPASCPTALPVHPEQCLTPILLTRPDSDPSCELMFWPYPRISLSSQFPSLQGEAGPQT